MRDLSIAAVYVMSVQETCGSDIGFAPLVHLGRTVPEKPLQCVLASRDMLSVTTADVILLMVGLQRLQCLDRGLLLGWTCWESQLQVIFNQSTLSALILQSPLMSHWICVGPCKCRLSARIPYRMSWNGGVYTRHYCLLVMPFSKRLLSAIYGDQLRELLPWGGYMVRSTDCLDVVRTAGQLSLLTQQSLPFPPVIISPKPPARIPN